VNKGVSRSWLFNLVWWN